MSVVSFQYLKQPFYRSFGDNGEWFEEESCPAPLKPYFNGSDSVPEDHPSKVVRDIIRNELGLASSSHATFPGNDHTSPLHEHEQLFQRLMKGMEQKEVEMKDGLIRAIAKGAFESALPFSDSVELLHFDNHAFVVPENCGFYVGNVLDFLRRPMPFQFDILEMDPPWKSKSTSRAKVYNERSNTDAVIDRVFRELPLESLCKDGCYVLVWITNDPKCIQRAMLPRSFCLIPRDFFAKRGIIHMSTAYWVKTTRDGSPLVPLSCPSRETFERLLVGKYCCDASFSGKRVKRERSPIKEELLHSVRQLSGAKKGEAPPLSSHCCDDSLLPKVPFLVSPVSFHSRKPNCAEFSFLDLPKEYRGLELFARQLRPNWYSVGDQALLFQSDLILHRRVSSNTELDLA